MPLRPTAPSKIIYPWVPLQPTAASRLPPPQGYPHKQDCPTQQTVPTAELPPQTVLTAELPPQTVLTAELPPQTGLPDPTPTAERSPLSPAQQEQLQTIMRNITAVPAVQHEVRELPVQRAVPVQPEVWHSPRGGILTQPDSNRVTIGGTANYRNGVLVSTDYTYADELPCIRNTMLVFVVLCFFVGTPISLLCTIPAYYFIKKVCTCT